MIPREPASGIYVHIPFCVRKCCYCDFNSYPVETGLARRYVRALLADIARAADRFTCAGRAGRVGRVHGAGCADFTASTLYVGGGTPTVIPSGDLARIVSACREAFGLGGDAEVTVECNPGTVDYSGLRELREAGVNRLSIGAQAFDDGLLCNLGRIHSAHDTMEAVNDARRAGFTNINLDLMFGLPGQTARHWQETLEQAVSLEPQHFSIYPLEVEDGTPLHYAVSEGETALPSEDEVVEMWDMAIETLEGSGFRRYEISNYSRPGYESKHNLIYWMNGEYLGLGAGACSHIGGRRYYNTRLPLDFCEAVEAWRSPVAEEVPPPGAAPSVLVTTEMAETIIMGLRLAEGLSLEEFQRRFRRPLTDVFPGTIQRLEALGLVSVLEGSVRLTRKGLFVGNAVFREFVPGAVFLTRHTPG